MKRKLLITTFLVWGLSTAGSAALRISGLLFPTKSPTDLEARWDYQLVWFVFLELPWRLLGLGVILGLIFLAFDAPRSAGNRA